APCPAPPRGAALAGRAGVPGAPGDHVVAARVDIARLDSIAAVRPVRRGPRRHAPCRSRSLARFRDSSAALRLLSLCACFLFFASLLSSASGLRAAEFQPVVGEESPAVMVLPVTGDVEVAGRAAFVAEAEGADETGQIGRASCR